MKKLVALALANLAVVSVAVAADKPTDAQIAAIVVAANTVDIDAGKLAAQHASSPDVKAFAQKMVTDHTSVNSQAVALVTKLGVKPEENATSQKLVSDAKATATKLSGMSGAAFDKAYVDNEVAYHEAVIGVVKDTLIPSATNPELKALLVKSAPAFIEHLGHAKSLQAKLAH